MILKDTFNIKYAIGFKILPSKKKITQQLKGINCILKKDAYCSSKRKSVSMGNSCRVK